MKRALIIGSETGGLAGVHNDVATISPRLEARGFELDVHTRADASRDGILAGLRRLITDSGPDDAALIYYSGHGARITNPRHASSGAGNQPKLLQSLVPTDWSAGEFRGLLGLELSLHLAELTEKTHNVAVILDCCHSARMWRGVGDDAVARALERAEVDTLGGRLEQVLALDLSKLHAESNPHAVRLVAAEADRSAYELMLEFQGKRQRMGIMTAMLCAVLDELGDARVSWRTLGMLVRERVMQRYDFQRPELEGPGRRYVFELAKAEFGGGVVYFQDRGQPALRTTRLLGAELGARYAIMATGCGEYDESKVVAEAEITSIAGTLAHVRLTPREGAPEPSMGALAFLLEAPLSTRAVRIRGEGAAAEPIRELIWASKYLSLATGPDSAAFIELEVGDQLTLFDDSGAALTFPERNDTAGQRRTLDELEARARAEALRNLGDGGLEARFEVEWGRVLDQRCRMTDGELVHVGDALYVELRNPSKVALLFAVFDIGVDGAISLLTAAEPSGTKVEPGESYVLGLELGNRGLPMSWPDHTPAAVPLPESLVVIACTDRHDFTALEGPAGRKSGPAASELEQILDQIGGGGIRNLGSERRADSGAYAVKRIDFLTSPQRRIESTTEAS